MQVQSGAELNLGSQFTRLTIEESIQVDPPSTASAPANISTPLPATARVNKPLVPEPPTPTITELLRDYMKWIKYKTEYDPQQFQELVQLCLVKRYMSIAKYQVGVVQAMPNCQ